MRFMRLLAVSAVIGGSVVGFAAPASADTMCEQAWLSGLLVSQGTTVGQCMPPLESPFCDYERVNLDPQLIVTTYVCLPPDTP